MVNSQQMTCMHNSKSNKRQHLLSTYCAPRLRSSALRAIYLIILIINLNITLLLSPFYRWENWGSMYIILKYILLIHCSIFTRSEDGQNLLDYFGKRTYMAKSRQVVYSVCMVCACVCGKGWECVGADDWMSPYVMLIILLRTVSEATLLFFPPFLYLFHLWKKRGRRGIKT